MMSKKQLTDRGYRSLPCPAAPGKQPDLHYDAAVPGLAVRVHGYAAQRAFVLVGRFPGSANPTARAIGRVGAVTLLCRPRPREGVVGATRGGG